MQYATLLQNASLPAPGRLRARREEARCLLASVAGRDRARELVEHSGADMTRSQPRSMPSAHRVGFVRFQQDLARQALLHGRIGAARVALRVLTPDDFAGNPAATDEHLAVLRDASATEDALLAAVRALLDLDPAGLR